MQQVPQGLSEDWRDENDARLQSEVCHDYPDCSKEHAGGAGGVPVHPMQGARVSGDEPLVEDTEYRYSESSLMEQEFGNRTCPSCRHAKHDGNVCLNMASDNDCFCKFGSPAVVRPSWNSYFLGIAQAVAARGDCRRRQVGCVIVDTDRRIIGTGYNGAEPGGPSCLRGQCPRGLKSQEELASGTGGYNDCVAIHAEANALLFARTSCKGATAYVSSAVCPDCAKLLRAAGVTRVIVGKS